MKNAYTVNEHDFCFDKTFQSTPTHKKFRSYNDFGRVILLMEGKIKEYGPEISAVIEKMIKECIQREDDKLQIAHENMMSSFPHMYKEDGTPKPDPAYRIYEDEEHERRRYWHGKGTAY